LPFAFTTIHHGEVDKLGLASELERFANDQWIGDRYSEEQAISLLMDRFEKLVQLEHELIDFKTLCLSSDKVS
jgi:hypothetical protein